MAAAAPDIAPFMADECLLAIPEIEGIDYTTKEYLNFVSHIQNTADRLSKESTWCQLIDVVTWVSLCSVIIVCMNVTTYEFKITFMSYTLLGHI